jgi:hypothetical protein
MSSELMGAITELELGGSEQLLIGLGDEQARYLEDLFTGADHEPVSQLLSIGFLLWAEAEL